MSKDIIKLEVDGMDCNNCATSISRFLERKGLEEVFVNFQTKEVRFRQDESKLPLEKAKAGILKLGYTIIEKDTPLNWWTLERKLLLGAIFTAPLLLQHILMMLGINTGVFEHVWVQFGLALPVYILGVWHFGVSAWKSLKGGVPNMDVLIFIGSSAAFFYSLYGALTHQPQLIFFETAATIITLVLIGNWLEKRAVQQTTTSIKELTKMQVLEARRIMPSGAIVSLPLENIKKGYILQVNEGDKVPCDGRIISGSGSFDESMITGESLPVEKGVDGQVVGASILLAGNIKIEVTAVGEHSILGKMIELVKMAQADKPQIQRLADKIGAIFVPVVVGIAILTIGVEYFFFSFEFKQAFLNGIAVLVISCPCAMGLATPTAVMVGVGRLAKNGILIKGGETLEQFAHVKNIVFDKTGTLTTGEFQIKKIEYFGDEAFINGIIYFLEKHSSHPIAKSLVAHFAKIPHVDFSQADMTVREEKGVGVTGTSVEGDSYQIGSSRILNGAQQRDGDIFLLKNGKLLASIKIEDTIKAGAPSLVDYLKQQDVHTVILSGDKKEVTKEVADDLKIAEYHGEMLPGQKLEVIEKLNHENLTAMVGDGINDAPALSKAAIGISMSNGSEVAISSAQIVLLNGHLDHLQKAMQISKATLQTIKQNLFWAFAYNVVAIPIAALGYLNPMWGALFMAFSDIVVIGNSIRLSKRKIQ